MKLDARVPVWRDWTLFAIKWLLLALFGAAIYLTRQESGAVDPLDGLVLPLAVGVVANVVLAALLMTNTHAAVEPVIALGDVAIAAFFVSQVDANAALVLFVAGALMLIGLLRLGTVWSAVQSIGILIAVVIALMMTDRPGSLNALSSGESTLSLLMLGGLLIAAIAGSYALERQVGEQGKRITELAKGETATLNQMRERTRAIYELSTTISSTLDYGKILEAALDAGRLAVRDGGDSFVSGAVLLFQGSDNILEVVASRGLTRNDAAATLQGKRGLVAEALAEAAPVFGENGAKDSELQYISAFHNSRSLLCVPLRSNYENYGVLVYGAERENAFDEEQTELLTAIGSQACVAMQNAVLYQSLLDEKERLVEVEEDARKKLARDLHDGPTQSVSAIAMRMSYIYKLFEKNPEGVPEELKKVEDLARKTAKEIRHMLFTLRPLVLETQGLGAALVQLSEKMQETHGQAVAVKMGRDFESYLTAHQQGTLFYIIEEAVNNARKHAQAPVINVQLGRQNQNLICRIWDEGVGFDTSIVTTNYEKRGSLGMVNMKERVELLGGKYQLKSEVGKGTAITIVVPLSSQPADTAPLNERNTAKPRQTSKLAASTIDRVGNPSR